MTEQIYAVAAALTAAAEEERPLLELLCRGEEKRLEKLLGERAEEWQEAVLCSAAFFAAAALLEGRSAGKAERFTVGDVSVDCPRGGERLREQAERMLCACGLGREAFSFREVRG